MSKEGKYTIYFLGFLCLLTCIAGMLSGCKSKGYQGLIYHEKDLIAKTSCEDEMFLTISPDTIEVRSVYNSYGTYWDKEVYKYKNDGKYRIEKKECDR
jgi:hypothetical protein